MIGVIAKPLYAIGGKTGGFDRRVNPVRWREETFSTECGRGTPSTACGRSPSLEEGGLWGGRTGERLHSLRAMQARAPLGLGIRGIGAMRPLCGKKHGGNRKSQGALARLCEFPGRFRFTALKGRNRVASFRLGCSASLSRPQGALGFDPPLNPLGTP